MEHFPLVDRLHTDVLEDHYGPISSKVVKHNSKIRKSHLIDKKGISRTFAITFFPFKLNKKLSEINKEVAAGMPIGKAFRNHKYSIRKNVIDAYILELPRWLKLDFKTKSNYAKARLSEFYAKMNSLDPEIYGVVVEIYSPDFRPPVINYVDVDQINPTTAAFLKEGISKSVIWKRLGSDNNWNDKHGSYLRAKESSLKDVFMYKELIAKELKSI